MNKNNTDFKIWFAYVVDLYSKGFLNCPTLGHDPDRIYKWYTPTEQQIKSFVHDEKVVAMYKKLYDEGYTPQYAFDVMD